MCPKMRDRAEEDVVSTASDPVPDRRPTAWKLVAVTRRNLAAGAAVDFCGAILSAASAVRPAVCRRRDERARHDVATDGVMR